IDGPRGIPRGPFLFKVMEASSARVTAPGTVGVWTPVRAFFSKYGLIMVLLALPVICALGDLLGWGHVAFIEMSNEKSLTRLGTNIKDGISNGSIWALVALGYTLVYGIIELINFAHGDVFMIGSFIAVGMYATLGLTTSTGAAGLFFGLFGTLIIAALGCAFLNMLIERVAYRPLRGAPKLAPLITAVGFSFILENVGLLWNGGQQQAVPDLINSQKQLFSLFGINVTHGDVLAIGVAIPLLIFLAGFVNNSRLGKAMRATAQEPEAARLMGINVDTTISATFVLGDVMAAAAGLIYAIYQTQIWYFQVFTAGLIAFTVAV